MRHDPLTIVSSAIRIYRFGMGYPMGVYVYTVRMNGLEIEMKDYGKVTLVG